MECLQTCLKPCVWSLGPHKPGTEVHTCKPSTWELEASLRVEVQDYSQLDSKFEASLEYKQPRLKINTLIT